MKRLQLTLLLSAAAALANCGARGQSPASSQSSEQEPKTPIEWFQRANEQMNLRMPESAPFHMKVAFHALPGEEMLGPKDKPQIQTGDGIYEETWLAPHQWRREVTFGDYHAVEVESDKGRKIQASSEYEPSRVLMLLGALFDQIPAYVITKESEIDWHRNWSIRRVSSGDVSMVCVCNSTSQSAVFTSHGGFYFLPRGLLVFGNSNRLTTSWLNDTVFGEKMVPRRITIQAPALKPSAPERELLNADVAIEAPSQVDPASFDLPGPPADPGLTLRPRLKFDRPPQSLSDTFIPFDHNAAIVFLAAIDRSGATRELEVIDAQNAQNLRETVVEMRKRKYRPAEVDGSRCEIPLHVDLTLEHHSEMR